MFADALRHLGIELTSHTFSTTAQQLAAAAAVRLEVKGGPDSRRSVHAAASEDSERLAMVPGGILLTVIRHEGDWYLIELIGGKQGFIHKKNVKTP